MRAALCVTAKLAADDRDGSQADMAARIYDVRFTPKSGRSAEQTACPLWAICGHRALFDHLVGPGEQLRMNFEAKRLGGFEVFVGKGSGL
jgi:hypothetical protein